MKFEFIDKKFSLLWDYGWFDLSVFNIIESQNETQHNRILSNFISSQLYPRSLCSKPDPWGADINRHGPFLLDKFSLNWFIHNSFEEFNEKINNAVYDPNFSQPPSKEQLKLLKSWVNRVKKRVGFIYSLEAPSSAKIRVEWAFVWTIFYEFIWISNSLDKIEVAIIGYD